MHDNLIQHLVKQLREDLQAIKSALSSLHQAININNEATDTTKKNENKASELRAILNFLESVQTDKKAAYTTQERYQIRNLLIALATLLALIAMLASPTA